MPRHGPRSRPASFRSSIFGLAFALVMGACTSSGDQTSSSPADSPESSAPAEASAEGSTEATSGAADQTGEGAAAAPDEIPPLPLLVPEPPVVEPGTDLAVTADSRLTGTVALAGPVGEVATAAMSGGAASIPLPAGLAPGVYALTLTDSPQGSAFGTVRVADGPGLWLAAPEFVAGDEAPAVTLTSYRLPSGTIAALEGQDVNLVTERLVPHPLLGLAPLPASGASSPGFPEGMSRWRLPEGFSGTVRAVADSPERLAALDPEIEFAFASAPTQIRRCDEPSGVIGALEGAGVASAVWVGSGVESTSAATDDGRFELAVRPGTVLVSATLREGGTTDASPLAVRVRCGEIVDVGGVDEPVDTGPAPGAYLGGLTFDDLLAYRANATGAVEFSHEGSADCFIDGDSLAISLTDFGSSDPFVYDLTVADFAGTGRYEGSFDILDVFGGGTADGTLTGELELGRVEEFDAVGGAFSGSIAGPLGNADIEVRFTCVLFGGFTSVSAPFDAATGLSGVLAAARTPPLMAQTAGGSGGEECRQLLMFAQGSSSADQDVRGFLEWAVGHWNARLSPGLSRVRVTDMVAVRGALGWLAFQQALGSGDEVGPDIAGAVAADLLVTIRVAQIGESWQATATGYDFVEATVLFRFVETGSDPGSAVLTISNRWSDAVDPLRRAGICGEIQPKSAALEIGDEEDFTYEVTDLAGEAVDGATVDPLSSDCGSFDPDGGPVDETEFDTTFRGETGGCTETRTFLARAPGTAGEVDTLDDAEKSVVSLTVAALWQFEITADLQEGSAMVHSESSGKFFVDEETGELIGAGTGTVHAEEPNAPCVVISEFGVDERIQLFTADGAYKVMVSGNLAAGDEERGGTVRFIPRGFQMRLDATWTDPDCFPPGSQRNEPFAMLIVTPLTLLPDVYAQQPQGFEVSISPGGTHSVQSFPLVTGGTVTIEVFRMEPAVVSQ